MPLQPSPTATPKTAPGAEILRFRVVNGSPGTGNVDVYLYPTGSLRPSAPTFGGVPFGAITPYIGEVAGQYTMDVLRAGAVQTAAAIASSTVVNYNIQLGPTQVNSGNASLVISGTSLNGTRAIQYFLEPFESSGRSALVVHHASPAATVVTFTGPIGIGVYSAAAYPPGTLASAIRVRAAKQLFALRFMQNPQAVALPNAVVAGMFYIAPFPVAPLPAAVGFAIGLPSTETAEDAPLASIVANAALSETASENSPYPAQIALVNDTSQTVAAGRHVSEFLIDADQNGNVGLIGTIDP